MNINLKKVSIRIIIIIPMLTLFIIFSLMIFFYFSNYYMHSIKENYSNELRYSKDVSIEILERDKNNLLKDSRILASNNLIYHAFDKDIYLKEDSLEKTEDERYILSSTPMSKLKFIKITNYAKQLL